MCSKELKGRKKNLGSSRVSGDISSGGFIPVGCVMFIVPETKYLTRNQLREELYYCNCIVLYNARAQIFFVGRSWQHRCEASGYVAPTVKKQRVEGWCSAFSF